MFENLHANHKLAFLDGLLSGIGIAYMANRLYQDYLEGKELERLAAETD